MDRNGQKRYRNNLAGKGGGSPLFHALLQALEGKTEFIPLSEIMEMVRPVIDLQKARDLYRNGLKNPVTEWTPALDEAAIRTYIYGTLSDSRRFEKERRDGKVFFRADPNYVYATKLVACRLCGGSFPVRECYSRRVIFMAPAQGRGGSRRERLTYARAKAEYVCIDHIDRDVEGSGAELVTEESRAQIARAHQKNYGEEGE